MFLNSIFFLSSFRSSFFFSLRCMLQQILRHFLFLFFTMAGIYKYCPKIVKEFCISNQPKKYNFETVNYLPSMNQITICNQNMNLISNLKYISFTITLHNFSILAIVFFWRNLASVSPSIDWLIARLLFTNVRKTNSASCGNLATSRKGQTIKYFELFFLLFPFCPRLETSHKMFFSK